MLSDPSHTRSAPTYYPMLTCAVNQLGEVDVKRFAFQMITSNKTIVFGCDSKEECEEWVSVLLNAKNQSMDDAFKNAATDMDSLTRGRKLNKPDERVRIVKGVIGTIRQLPGNNVCADCNCPDPAWFSVNLGVLVCIECSGLHREMGVQVCRVFSTICVHNRELHNRAELYIPIFHLYYSLLHTLLDVSHTQSRVG